MVDFPAPVGPTTARVVPTGTAQVDVLQDGAPGSIGESDAVEAQRLLWRAGRDSAGFVLHRRAAMEGVGDPRGADARAGQLGRQLGQGPRGPEEVTQVRREDHQVAGGEGTRQHALGPEPDEAGDGHGHHRVHRGAEGGARAGGPQHCRDRRVGPAPEAPGLVVLPPGGLDQLDRHQ